MNKKYLSVILFGALMLGTTGTFTSCKDYDDDINNLQEQIDKLATKEDMTSQIAALQTALDAAKSEAAAAKAAAEEALAKANSAASTATEAEKAAAQAALDAANAKEEAIKAAQDEVAKVKAELKAAIEADFEAMKEELAKSINDLTKKIEELTGYTTEMLTSIHFETNPALNLNYYRVGQISYPKNLTKYKIDGGYYVENDRDEVNSYEFGKGLTGAFTVAKGDVNTVPDAMLINVAPVNAVVTSESLSLVNGTGANLNDYVDISASTYSGQIIKWQTRANGTGLHAISVQLKNTVDFESFDKLVITGTNHAIDVDNCNGDHNYIAYALAATDSKSRTVTSDFDVTMHVQKESKATNIEQNSYIYSSGELNVDIENRIGNYAWGADDTYYDENCFSVVAGEPFVIEVGAYKGHIMGSYVVVDYENDRLSATDKAALRGITFNGVDQVLKGLEHVHVITMNGQYAAGIPVPLKLVTIDYTGNVEVNVVWVKVGEPVLMNSEFTVTPTKNVSNALSWVAESSMEEFKVPAAATKYELYLATGESNHQIQNEFIESGSLADINSGAVLRLYASNKTTQTTVAKDIAYAKFIGSLNLTIMREDKAYIGEIKFYDQTGTYLGTNSISVKKVLPTAIPTGLTAKTNAIHADGTLPVYPKPGTSVGEYDLANSFNFTDALKADANLKFVTPTFVNGTTVYAQYGANRTIINIAKDVIGSDNTYPTTVTYDYGDIQYHPEGHGVEEPGNWVVAWNTKFNIKFGCYPVDSEYAWYTAPTVYYQTNTTIVGTDGKKNYNFMTVKNPYGYKVDAFDADDEEWTTWADAFNQGVNKEVYLLTNGDRKNEFFTPSFEVVGDVTGLKLERDPSMTTVLETDVETTVVLVVTDKFGHKHEIKALTFTMKKDAKDAK